MFIPAFSAVTAGFIAQVSATGPASTQPATPGWAQFVQMLGSMFPIILIMVAFIWFTTRSRRRQEKQKKEMLNAIKRGDRVQTIGGVLANVVEVRDDRILLKVDESNNTKVWFARSAVGRVLGDDAEAK